ncbi:Uncharacterised protein [Bordetella pertussis]|nr:Uncharacterised protein [Bordetella pertussis]
MMESSCRCDETAGGVCLHTCRAGCLCRQAGAPLARGLRAARVAAPRLRHASIRLWRGRRSAQLGIRPIFLSVHRGKTQLQLPPGNFKC